MKNNKGFTLIELLVVVAIIGILAAVGTVAYQGYTSGAKKNATKSNHASVTKFIAAELAKCSMGDGTVFTKGTAYTCNAAASGVPAAAVDDLAEFKNAFDTATAAVQTVATDGAAAGTVKGVTHVTVAGSTISITTCYEEIGTGPACDVDSRDSTLINTVDVE